MYIYVYISGPTRRGSVVSIPLALHRLQHRQTGWGKKKKMQPAEPTRQRSRLGHWWAVIGRKVFLTAVKLRIKPNSPPPRKFITRVVSDTRFIIALFLCSCVPYTSLMENGIVGCEEMVALERLVQCIKGSNMPTQSQLFWGLPLAFW